MPTLPMPHSRRTPRGGTKMARMRTRMPKGVITMAMAASERGREEARERSVGQQDAVEWTELGM